MRLIKSKAVEIMRAVQGGECFFNNDGKVFCSLADFAREITAMSQPVFNFHCNSKKCDFADWIVNVLHDDKLAKDMFGAKGIRPKVEELVLKRAGQLEKYL